MWLNLSDRRKCENKAKFKKKNTTAYFRSNKKSIVQNKSNRKSYGWAVFIGHLGKAIAMEPQTTLNTVCHDSIISYLVSRYQMLSSAKPNWFVAEMKGRQTVIHHGLCHYRSCLHLCQTFECVCLRVHVCAEPEKWKTNKQLTSYVYSLFTG